MLSTSKAVPNGVMPIAEVYTGVALIPFICNLVGRWLIMYDFRFTIVAPAAESHAIKLPICSPDICAENAYMARAIASLSAIFQ